MDPRAWAEHLMKGASEHDIAAITKSSSRCRSDGAVYCCGRD
jgi:hypothetical protein